MRWVKTVFWLLLFMVAILFSVQNRDEVMLKLGLHPFLDFEREITGVPLFLVILCSIFLGVLIGGMSDLYRRFQLKATVRQQQKTIENLKAEVNALQKVDPARVSAGKREAGMKEE